MSEIVDIVRSNDVRNLLTQGVNKLVDSVKITMGAGGKNVLIEKPFSNPILTKDGVTVAKSINLENKFENMGAQLIKQAAQKTADEVGDGTTTSTVLAGSIFNNSLIFVNSGYNPIKIKRWLDLYVSRVVDILNSMAKPVNDFDKIYHVAKISCNGDEEIAKSISNAMEIVGEDGVITVENSNSFETKVEYTEGLQFDCGYASPYFVNNPKKLETHFDSPYILLINGIINDFSDIEEVLIKSLKNNKPILILANDFSNEVINKSIQNRLHNNLKICLVRLPYYAENRLDFIEDLSTIFNCQYINTDLGEKINDRANECLTVIDKVIVGKNNTTLIKQDQNRDEIKSRIEQIKLKLSQSNSPVEQNILRERLSKLSGSVAIIKVGGLSEVEVQEKKDRIDDALHATKASIKEGIVIGGGYALFRCVDKLTLFDNTDRENLAAFNIMKETLKAPVKQILENAGYHAEEILYLDDIKSNDESGFNVASGNICNLFDEGIIDPVLVETTALLNAASVAGMLITTNCGIALQKKEDELM